MNVTRKTSTDIELQLNRRELQHFGDLKPGTTVVCEKGILWLTQSNDFRDYTLASGQKMVISKQGKVLIEALKESDLQICSPN